MTIITIVIVLPKSINGPADGPTHGVLEDTIGRAATATRPRAKVGGSNLP